MAKDKQMMKTQKLAGPITAKNIPSVCANCNKVFRISVWEIEDGKRSGVSHGLCDTCFQKLNKAMDDE